MKNTVALYTFYEKNGIVRDFVLYYLEELKKEISDIIVIVNGKLSPEGRLKLEKIGVDILVRENKGLDFGAWKAGIEYVGWEKIRKLDGLLLCNCTCYGPVYPFKEIFDAMAKKDCDFWGINRHPEMDVYLIPNDPCSKVKEHIQSYFLFFKPHLLKSNHFNLISPSRDDPMPVVMTEGLMLQKICLCSTNCGTADYIEDGKNGFVFQSENADELAEKIMYIVDNFENLDSVRLFGRKLYEKYFTPEVFEKNILKIINNICKKTS